jgi:hypothetical protein
MNEENFSRQAGWCAENIWERLNRVTPTCLVIERFWPAPPARLAALSGKLLTSNNETRGILFSFFFFLRVRAAEKCLKCSSQLFKVWRLWLDEVVKDGGGRLITKLIHRFDSSPATIGGQLVCAGRFWENPLADHNETATFWGPRGAS